MRNILVSVVLSFTVGACGSGSPYDPGAGDSAGSGTATLVVNGSASASPRVANATQPADFSTEFNVRITLNNTVISTGTVTMTSSSGEVPLTFRPDLSNGGRWQATGGGYDEVYQLDVVSGTDAVHGVRVDGPGIHVFSAPQAGAVVDSTMALPLAWTRDEAADAAVLRVTDGGDGITIADTGTYMMAPVSLRSSRDQAQTNTIELRRTNRVAPAGAAGGSELSVSVENTIDVVAQINPNAP